MQRSDNREPRPGHRILRGRETYDIGAHIERAFQDVPPGHTLTAVEIMHGGRRDDIPESRHIGVASLVARLTHNPPGDIRFKYNEAGTLVGFKIAKTHQVGTNMVHYRTQMADGPFVSIQPPTELVRIITVQIEKNLDDGVDVTVVWEAP